MIRTFLSIIICGVLFACSIESPLVNGDPQPAQEIIRDEDRVIIVDQTGKEWDVTHAVNNYGFKPERFQFGLGPFAIRPIQLPQMLSPGDDGYPASSVTTTVIGATINGHTRAYPLSVLSSHEIVNEQFGSAHVSVAY